MQQKINCIVVDDEPIAAGLVTGYVNKTPFLNLVATCNNVFEAMEVISREKIDLIFLDIQMPEVNGVTFSKTLHPNIKIIFTTAFKEYALDGFKVNALDYLLKPFNYEEFLKGANKALEWFEVHQEKTSGSSRNFIFVKSEYKQLKVNLDEIYYFEGLKDYVKIWLTTQEKSILTLMSLKKLEQELPPEKFMRIHRSFIIAMDKIEVIERNQVIIRGERITIADQYKDKFQAFIESNSFN